MKKFIQAIDYNIWEAIELGPFIPTIVNESTSETNVSALEKPRDQWSEKDRRKIQYNLKAQNIITSALGIYESAHTLKSRGSVSNTNEERFLSVFIVIFHIHLMRITLVSDLKLT